MAFRVRVVVKTVAAAGTPVAGPSVFSKKVTLRAPAGNAGKAYYGGSDIAAATRGELQAGESQEFEAPDREQIDLSDLRFDAANNGDKVEVIYYDHFMG
jgi:hypothetical protein